MVAGDGDFENAMTSTTVRKEGSQAQTSKPTDSSSTYAIVECSGQQFWLQPSRYYDIDRLSADTGATVVLNDVLLVRNGAESSVGKPTVPGASVELKVLSHRRGPKLTVYKMRPKKKTRRKSGHRQELTRVYVTSITVGGTTLT